MESLKRSRTEAGIDVVQMHNDLGLEHGKTPSLDSDDSLVTDDLANHGSRPNTPQPKAGKKTRGRVKINMEFIDNKLRRYTTFSKRKSGIMKKAHELATLTGTQVMLLVASETGHVYTFATRKLQPILSSEAGKQLIQTCLNSPDPGEVTPTGNAAHDDQRMSAQGFEEPELSYAPPEDSKEAVLEKTYHILNRISSQQEIDHPSVSEHQVRSHLPVNFVSVNEADMSKASTLHIPAAQALTLMPAATGAAHLDPQPLHLTSTGSNVSMQMLPVAHQTSPTPPNVSLSERVQAKHAEESRIALLNPYATLQRTAAGVQPLLVTGAGSIHVPPSQVAFLGQPNYGSNKKASTG